MQLVDASEHCPIAGGSKAIARLLAECAGDCILVNSQWLSQWLPHRQCCCSYFFTMAARIVAIGEPLVWIAWTDQIRVPNYELFNFRNVAIHGSAVQLMQLIASYGVQGARCTWAGSLVNTVAGFLCRGVLVEKSSWWRRRAPDGEARKRCIG